MILATTVVFRLPDVAKGFFGDSKKFYSLRSASFCLEVTTTAQLDRIWVNVFPSMSSTQPNQTISPQLPKKEILELTRKNETCEEIVWWIFMRADSLVQPCSYFKMFSSLSC